MFVTLRRKPPEALACERFPIPAIIFALDDCCIELPLIEEIQEFAGAINPHFDGELRIMGVQPRQQRRHFRSCDMRGNAEGKAPRRRVEPGNRTLMRCDEFPRSTQKASTAC